MGNSGTKDVPKYHIGEDWNGVCGLDSDFGAPLYAIADGEVFAIYEEGSPESSGGGKVLRIKHNLPDGKIVYSQYLHLSERLVSLGNPVYKNKTVIAKIGGTGGVPPHLHWDMIMDAANYKGGNPSNLKPQEALAATSGSLFVDDRGGGGVRIIPTTNNNWTFFTVPVNTPSSTAYIETLSGWRHSIKRAVDLGIIANYGIIWQEGGGWYYYPDVTQVFLKPNVNYAILAKNDNLSLNLLLPGNNYPKERAQMDMIWAASADTRFTNVRMETYGENLTEWSPDWELRYMNLDFATPAGTQYVTVCHATHKTNPLWRLTTYYDPAVGQWTPWKEVGMNVLH